MPEALGGDYAIAKRKCDDVLNPHYKAWLTNGEADLSAPRAPSGTWDWMVGVYKTSPKYTSFQVCPEGWAAVRNAGLGVNHAGYGRQAVREAQSEP